MIGRTKVFRRMLDFPKFSWLDEPLELEEFNPRGGRIGEVKIKETEIREVIKGMWEGADLESFRPFLYPAYKVELLRKRRRGRFGSTEGTERTLSCDRLSTCG